MKFKLKLKVWFKVKFEWSNFSQIGSQMFDFGHSNDKSQNDLNFNLFDVGHSNCEGQNDINVECQTV